MMAGVENESGSCGPSIAAREPGGALKLPSESGRAQPPIVFWCILGINLHLSECLNEEEFPVFILH